MSGWFKRLRSFVEDEDILANDFEAELDGVAAALNGLVMADRVAATGALFLSTTAIQDVPGTDVTLNLDRPSKVVVNLVANLEAKHGYGEARRSVFAMLNVDGVDSHKAEIDVEEGWVAVQGTMAQTYVLKLGSGAHKLKMRAGMDLAGTNTGFVWVNQTGYSYIVFPDPEP